MTISMMVTGAASGIGFAIAQAAADRGDRVGLIDRDPAVLDSAAMLNSAALLDSAAALANVTGFVASVDDPAAIEQALDTFGTPDVWVNNAGIVRFGPLLDLAVDDWKAVVDTNLTAVFTCGQAVARRMAERGSGAIVNVTSMNGVAPGPNSGAYGSAKAAVALLTQQMALEWGPLGIRVNAVAPGLIDAGMSEPIYADPETRKARESRVPLGRLGEAHEVAEAVLFLADQQTGYITGQNLLVDGGVTMSVISTLPRPASVDSVGHDRTSSDAASKDAASTSEDTA